jgi:hypothetical protein
MKKIQKINISIIEKSHENIAICEKVITYEPMLINEECVVMIEQGNLQGFPCYMITMSTGDKIFTDDIKPIIGYSNKL